jgi:hypothetical protein
MASAADLSMVAASPLVVDVEAPEEATEFELREPQPPTAITTANAAEAVAITVRGEIFIHISFCVPAAWLLHRNSRAVCIATVAR